jgi:hypothetical protein
MAVYPAVMENLLRDIRHTLRGLLKTPVFALSVVFTLALGIGGNTALFSVVDQLLLRPLPYPDGDRLVTVYEKWLTGGGSGLPDASRGSVSPANWLDWQRDSRTIERFAAWRATPLTMTGVGDPVYSARSRSDREHQDTFGCVRVEPFAASARHCIITPRDPNGVCAGQ